MAEKLGNGGHGQENYDPETGKYVESEKSKGRVIGGKFYSEEKLNVLRSLGLSDDDIRGDSLFNDTRGLGEDYDVTGDEENEVEQSNPVVEELWEKIAPEKPSISKLELEEMYESDPEETLRVLKESFPNVIIA